MTTRLYDEIDIKRALRAAVRSAGSQDTFAQSIKVSKQFIGDVLRGDRAPSEKIATALGFNRVTRWVRRVPSKGGLP